MNLEKDFLTYNRESWNNRLAHHLDSELYDMKSFMAGRNSIDEVSQRCLGDIVGKDILHLQCHFGQDTLSMARMGGNCTGVDLSNSAIDKAKALNAELGLNASFIESDVYSVPQTVSGQFDIVYSTFGTIGWLPDMERWAEVVSQKLRVGGKLILVEFHPLLWIFDELELKTIEYSYFNESAIIEDLQGTYTDRNAKIDGKQISWNHPISEVLQALLAKGMRVSSFEEFDYSPYKIFGEMDEIGPMKFRTKQHGTKLPYFYALQCVKS